MSTNCDRKGSVISNIAGQKIRHFTGLNTVAKAAFSPREMEGQGIEDPIIVNQRPTLAEKLEQAGAGCGSCTCHGGDPPAAKVSSKVDTPGSAPPRQARPKIFQKQNPDPKMLEVGLLLLAAGMFEQDCRRLGQPEGWTPASASSEPWRRKHKSRGGNGPGGPEVKLKIPGRKERRP